MFVCLSGICSYLPLSSHRLILDHHRPWRLPSSILAFQRSYHSGSSSGRGPLAHVNIAKMFDLALAATKREVRIQMQLAGVPESVAAKRTSSGRPDRLLSRDPPRPQERHDRSFRIGCWGAVFERAKQAILSADRDFRRPASSAHRMLERRFAHSVARLTCHCRASTTNC